MNSLDTGWSEEHTKNVPGSKRKLHGVLQNISPTLKYWPHPFLPSTPSKILNLSSLSPFKSNSHQNFGELDLTPLKSTLVQKCKDSFCKRTKDFITNNEIRTIWMLKYGYTVANSKNQRKVRLLLSIIFLLGS